MTKNINFSASLIAGFVLSTVLTGCMTAGPGQGRGYRGSQAGQTQAIVIYHDDYDYYPSYEVYYSRNRHEYVYRDGNAWVRRSEPRGVTVNMLLAAPAVRLDFHDSPEQHHGNVVRSYPKNWKSPGKANDDKKHDKKAQEGKDKNEHRPDNGRRN